MTGPQPPGLARGVEAVFRLQWKRLVRGRKLRLGGLAWALVLLAAVATRYLGEPSDPAEVMATTIRWGFLTLLVFLLPFLFHAGSVAEEVEGRTFTYLAVRPVGRIALVLGKYAAGTAMTLALLVGGAWVIHLLVFATDPSGLLEAFPSTLRSSAALALLGLFYGGVCMFWGAVVPQAGGILATLHLAAWEFALTWAPGVVRLVSMNHMARVVAEVELGGLMVQHVPMVASGVAAAIVAVLALMAVAASALAVELNEYRHARA